MKTRAKDPSQPRWCQMHRVVWTIAVAVFAAIALAAPASHAAPCPPSASAPAYGTQQQAFTSSCSFAAMGPAMGLFFSHFNLIPFIGTISVLANTRSYQATMGWGITGIIMGFGGAVAMTVFTISPTGGSSCSVSGGLTAASIIGSLFNLSVGVLGALATAKGVKQRKIWFGKKTQAADVPLPRKQTLITVR